MPGHDPGVVDEDGHVADVGPDSVRHLVDCVAVRDVNDIAKRLTASLLRTRYLYCGTYIL